MPADPAIVSTGEKNLEGKSELVFLMTGSDFHTKQRQPPKLFDLRGRQTFSWNDATLFFGGSHLAANLKILLFFVSINNFWDFSILIKTSANKFILDVFAYLLRNLIQILKGTKCIFLFSIFYQIKRKMFISLKICETIL